MTLNIYVNSTLKSNELSLLEEISSSEQVCIGAPCDKLSSSFDG